ncbi:MAG: PD40 domain-containing protein, partial [Acidobacteriaceae bacterium]|nr:PD40 domain-containing protein [Acidobacteriaceae bacterium]
MRVELQRILDSSLFVHSQNLQRLLKHVVELTLCGRSDEIKEYALGVEVFNRGSSFDPRTDTIVRVEARRLRSRLNEYYSGEGAAARILISIPKGSYVPEFCVREDVQTPPPPTRPARHHEGVLWWASALIAVLGIGLPLAFWLRPKPTVNTVYSAVPLTNYSGHEICPSFSPDGERVAFAWDGEKRDNFDIYIKQIGVAEPLRLTTDPRADLSPAWSPDGRTIAFLRVTSSERAEVLLTGPFGGPAQRVAEVAAPQLEYWRLRLMAWSPDSKWLVVSDGPSPDSAICLCLVSLETGEKRALTSPPGAFKDFDPAFSPDMKQLAFIRYEATSNIYVISLSKYLYTEGNPKQLTFGNGGTGSPVWTRDGRALLFARREGAGAPSLWRVTLSEPRKLDPLPIPADNADSIALSPQRGRLVYGRTRNDANIWGLELPASPSSGPLNLISKIWIASNT